jgi:hypothetical protein
MISSDPQSASATSGAHPATSPEQHYFDPAIPSETRRAALRELWRSEPLFAERDGLLDYDGDYSDEATVPARAVETAFVGTRGLLSESEAEAWAKLGRKNLSRRA